MMTTSLSGDRDDQEKVILSWRGVTRTFPGSPEVHALRPTDFDVIKGEFHSIIGQSGSGKSTMLNLLGLLDTPTSGKYTLLGQNTEEMNDPKRSDLRLHSIAYIFQSFYLLDKRSVIENVALPLTYRGLPLQQRRAAAEVAIERVGLSHRIDADTNTLSGGERQRVAIARAIVGDPQLLLCDEPTGNLDSDNANHILDMIEEINESGTAVIVVTHDERAARRASKRWRLQSGNFRLEMPNT